MHPQPWVDGGQSQGKFLHPIIFVKMGVFRGGRFFLTTPSFGPEGNA